MLRTTPGTAQHDKTTEMLRTTLGTAQHDKTTTTAGAQLHWAPGASQETLLRQQESEGASQETLLSFFLCHPEL